MPEQHAFLSPSGAKLWLKSPACWYKPAPTLTDEEQRFVDSFTTKNTAAEEGTLGHEITERILRKEYDRNPELTRPMRKLRQSKYFSYDLERRAKWCAKQTIDIIDQYDDDIVELSFEKRVYCSSIHPELWGTSDVVILTKDTLHIVDFKFGRLPVYALNNPQLKIYAYGALDTMKAWDDVEIVCGTILQPRDYDASEMTIRPSRLRKWGQSVVKPQALKTANKTGAMNPSIKTCRYCKHRVTDASHRAMFLKAIGWEEGRTVNDLDMKEIEEIAANAATLKQWIADVEQFAQAKAYGGYPFKKVKLVRGHSRRSFKNPKRVMKRLSKMGLDAKAYMKEPEVKPLTEIEALLGKSAFEKKLGSLVKQTENRPRLVAADNKAQSYQKTNDEVADMFGL